MSWLNDAASLNAPDRSVTLETSQVLIGPFGAEHNPAGDLYRHDQIATRSSRLDWGKNTVVALAVAAVGITVVVVGADCTLNTTTTTTTTPITSATLMIVVAMAAVVQFFVLILLL